MSNILLGGYAQDQGVRGKVIDFRIQVEVTGVRVAPGDIVFGDLDGVCMVPSDAIKETFRRAIERVLREKAVQPALEKGMSARQAFAK